MSDMNFGVNLIPTNDDVTPYSLGNNTNKWRLYADYLNNQILPQYGLGAMARIVGCGSTEDFSDGDDSTLAYSAYIFEEQEWNIDYSPAVGDIIIASPYLAVGDEIAQEIFTWDIKLFINIGIVWREIPLSDTINQLITDYLPTMTPAKTGEVLGVDNRGGLSLLKEFNYCTIGATNSFNIGTYNPPPATGQRVIVRFTEDSTQKTTITYSGTIGTTTITNASVKNNGVDFSASFKANAILELMWIVNNGTYELHLIKCSLPAL